MRNGLTQEMEEELLREVNQVYEEANIHLNEQVANVACDMINVLEEEDEEAKHFAVPWENQPSGGDGGDHVIMRALKFQRNSFPYGFSEQSVYRSAALVNPYVKRFMVQEEMDVPFTDAIHHPKYTHVEDTAFIIRSTRMSKTQHSKTLSLLSAKTHSQREIDRCMAEIMEQ